VTPKQGPRFRGTFQSELDLGLDGRLHPNRIPDRSQDRMLNSVVPATSVRP
jgi:hypothetical protein